MREARCRCCVMRTHKVLSGKMLDSFRTPVGLILTGAPKPPELE